MAFVCPSCKSDPESAVLARLQGTWISDREGTVAAMRADEQWKDRLEAIDQLEPLFGRLTITYEGNVTVAQMDGLREEGIIVIWEAKGNRARFTTFDKDDSAPFTPDENRVFEIEVHDDHYWMIIDGPRVFRERFIRVEKPSEG